MRHIEPKRIIVICAAYNRLDFKTNNDFIGLVFYWSKTTCLKRHYFTVFLI